MHTRKTAVYNSSVEIIVISEIYEVIPQFNLYPGAKSLNCRLLIFGQVAPDINIPLLFTCELDTAWILNATLLITKQDYLILFWLNP
jgi:hypothetical protein